MMRIFISQPMNGRTDNEIWNERIRIIEGCEKEYGEHYSIINSMFDENNPVLLLTEDLNPLGYLAMSLLLLSKADAAIFADGWQDTRGCVIEHMCCEKYGVEILCD